MEHAAYHAQPDWAKPVLFALACRYHGYNNGDLSLPFSEAKRLGISAQWKLYASLRLLERARLILCTRRGRLAHGKKLCSLYAITWRAINKCEGVEFDSGVSPCLMPPNDWAQWTKPSNWMEVVKAIKRTNHGQTKNPVTRTVGNGRSTTVGAAPAITAQQPREMEGPTSAPIMVDPSKTLGRGQDATPRPSSQVMTTLECPVQQLDQEAKIHSLELSPHLQYPIAPNDFGKRVNHGRQK